MKRKDVKLSTKIEPGKIFVMTNVLPMDSRGKTSPLMLLSLRQHGQYRK